MAEQGQDLVDLFSRRVFPACDRGSAFQHAHGRVGLHADDGRFRNRFLDLSAGKASHDGDDQVPGGVSRLVDRGKDKVRDLRDRRDDDDIAGVHELGDARFVRGDHGTHAGIAGCDRVRLFLCAAGYENVIRADRAGSQKAGKDGFAHLSRADKTDVFHNVSPCDVRNRSSCDIAIIVKTAADFQRF